MKSKARVHAALTGQPVDRMPVTSLYNQLYHLDHFEELTGRPQWQSQQWLYEDPATHLATYRRMVEAAPFEILQPQLAPAREVRASVEFIERDGAIYRRDKRRDTLTPLDTVSGHATDYRANETQTIFDKADVREKITITRAEDLIATGVNDYVEAAVAAFGDEHFIMPGGVIGTPYTSHWYVGLTNLYALMAEDADLIDYLCQKMLELNIETIRQLAAAGGDAIYIDDATTTSDMISVAHYERFSLPYMREMVREIHSLGFKAILIYFGGIADRLEQIASIGADGLLFESSMKGYVNDVDDFARRIGDRVTLFGNLDPIGVLQDGSDVELEAEIIRQTTAGRHARGFISSTSSPITPATPLSRVRRFIELSKQYGAVESPI